MGATEQTDDFAVFDWVARIAAEQHRTLAVVLDHCAVGPVGPWVLEVQREDGHGHSYVKHIGQYDTYAEAFRAAYAVVAAADSSLPVVLTDSARAAILKIGA